MTDVSLEQAFAYATARVHEANGNVFALPLPVQTVAVIETTQVKRRGNLIGDE